MPHTTPPRITSARARLCDQQYQHCRTTSGSSAPGRFRQGKEPRPARGGARPAVFEGVRAAAHLLATTEDAHAPTREDLRGLHAPP